ncbi:hypothetical protein N802_04165 [Knoellia sinensis KCTC 19936]|uniref:Major facilitator superfamily (MFS) profile domain-containing protein n=1 Tax=Knoellia sinensis KCTC 19936 TaxID=1385520 RepID=A0A0A0J3L3_9MICO|nr:MFS transporter [Knoellia sinensis]KGN31289.1 hypothetical protein N802_04165 [Knoellia sinensis KCTC 19936]
MESAPPAGGRLWTPDFVRITFMDLAYFLAAGIMIYALPLYVVGPIGASERGAGLAFGAFTLTALVLRPYAGRLTDRVGRRPLLVGGAALAVACTLGFLFTTSIEAVIALRLFSGVAEAFVFVAGFAILADLAPAGRQGEALSLNSVALYLGIATGPVLAERVVALGGFEAAFWTAAGLCLIAVALAWTLTEPPRETPGETGDPAVQQLIHRPTIAPSLGFLTGVFAASGFMAFCIIRAEEIGLTSPSVVLLAYGGTVIAVRVGLPSVADRFPPLRVLASGIAIIVLGSLMAAAATSSYMLPVAAAVIGLGMGFVTPAFFAAVFATVPASQRGAASGTATMAIDLGLGGGPIVFGLVAAPLGIPAAFAVGAGAAGLGLLWTMTLIRRRRPSAGLLAAQAN